MQIVIKSTSLAFHSPLGLFQKGMTVVACMQISVVENSSFCSERARLTLHFDATEESCNVPNYTSRNNAH